MLVRDAKVLKKLMAKFNRLKNQYPGAWGKYFFEMDLRQMGGFVIEGKKYKIILNADGHPFFENPKQHETPMQGVRWFFSIADECSILN